MIVTDSESAEEAALAHMQWLGYFDAKQMPPGRDEGIDVISQSAVAQVKDYGKPVGRPAIQQHFGVATDAQRKALFYCRAGFTAEAQAFADRVGMATFRLGPRSTWEPTNLAGRVLEGPRPER